MATPVAVAIPAIDREARAPDLAGNPRGRVIATPDVALDAKGLNCPLPILKAKKAMKDVPAGGTLEVLATDPGAVADFESFCRSTGHTLVEWSQEDGVFRFLIRSKA